MEIKIETKFEVLDTLYYLGKDNGGNTKVFKSEVKSIRIYLLSDELKTLDIEIVYILLNNVEIRESRLFVTDKEAVLSILKD